MIEEKNKIRDWLLDQKNSLDDCIRKAASSYYGLNNKTSNFSYDVNVCNNESYNLSRGKDLFYDRPGTAFSYSLWYQGRRINMLLPYFLDLIYYSRDRDKLEVFDLGAGTGAVQIALGLIVKGFDINGVKCPQIRVVNIDTSAIMLEYSRSYLWKAFDSQFEVKNLIQPSYSNTL